MDVRSLHAFKKEAVSAGRVLALLKARAGQGARVAPKLMQRAEQAAAQGAKSTPAAVRRTALGAGESARAAQGAKTLAARSGVGAERAAFQGRVKGMDQALGAAPESVTAGFTNAALGTTRGYSPAAANFMAGKGTLARAQQVTRANPVLLSPRGAVPAGAAAGGTAAGTPITKLRAAAGAGGSTAAGIPSAMTKRVNPAGATQLSQVSRPASGAGAAYEATVLARRNAVRR